MSSSNDGEDADGSEIIARRASSITPVAAEGLKQLMCVHSPSDASSAFFFFAY